MSKTARRPKVIDPGYRAPDIQPEETICARIYIPNDMLHIAAFWGAVEELTKWTSWERGGEKAKDAATVWKNAWQLSRKAWENCAGECGIVDIRQSEGTPCLIEKKVDCDEWETAIDMRLCAPKLRTSGGVLQQETQPGLWVNVSENDEPFDDRIHGYVPISWPDPPSGEDAACLSTLNALAYIYKRVQDIAIANRDYVEWLTWFSVIVAGFALLVGVGLIVVILAGLIITLVNEFTGDWGDVVLYDPRDDIKCIVYAAYEVAGDGTMSASDWQTLQDGITAEKSNHSNSAERVALELCRIIIWALGPVGMSRLSNYAGISSGDCDGCTGYDITFDFEASDGDWYCGDRHEWRGECAAVYHSGSGWGGVIRQHGLDILIAAIDFDFNFTTINYFEACVVTERTQQENSQVFAIAFHDGTGWGAANYMDYTQLTNGEHILLWQGNNAPQRLGVQVEGYYLTTNTRIKWVRIKGKL